MLERIDEGMSAGVGLWVELPTSRILEDDALQGCRVNCDRDYGSLRGIWG